ncbi:MAG: type II secretion system protein [Minisyncoccia bacterium]
MIKYLKEKSNGFTIVELIVSLGVITMLASFLILYNKTNTAQIALSLETAKLVELINKSKSLSLSTYIEKGAACGYGINIDYNSKSYTLFRYGSPTLTSGCANIASSSINFLDSTYAELEKNFLPQNINFEKNNDYLNIIFFMPPDPKVLIWKNNSTLPIQQNNPDYESKIYLTTKDSSFKKQIIVDTSGQISY